MTDFSIQPLWQIQASGYWKQSAEDFEVDELWTPAAEGQGEHILLWLEKNGQNTEWVARQIARFAGVRDFDVGLHGLKDRHAVTRQWMSVYLGKKPEPNWAKMDIEGTKILKVSRTPKKLRRGEHGGNRFKLWVRQVKGDQAALDDYLQQLAQGGFPNYFGMQRFGHDGHNLEQADAWFRGEAKPGRKAQRGMYLSAARSYLFNRILAQRVIQANWHTLIDGDTAMAAASVGVGDEGAPVTVTDGGNLEDHHAGMLPSGPLFGGPEYLRGAAGAIEQAAVVDYDHWLSGLHKEGMRTARRPFVANAGNLEWNWQGDDLQLSFDLGTGSFASVFLEQCFELH